jgi:translation initiation factor IF-3
VIDENGNQIGVIDTGEALALARQRGVDLVEVAPQARPPVARLMDYGRFKYEQSKKDRETKKQQHTSQLREVRMKAKIDKHDIDFKTRIAEKLLLRGDKVKVSVMFRGREITHPEIGRRLLDGVVATLEPISAMEKSPSLEGRMMTTILAPDKKKIAARERELQKQAAESGVPVAVEDDDIDLDELDDLVDDDDLDEDEFDEEGETDEAASTEEVRDTE